MNKSVLLILVFSLFGLPDPSPERVGIGARQHNSFSVCAAEPIVLSSDIDEKETISDCSTTGDRITRFIRFEDYSSDKQLATIAKWFREVKENDRSLRIAFLGDSFIEGDILTADVREQLQSQLGGQGVGFVPITSVASKFRYTVDHTFNGWKSYSVMNHKNADWKKLALTGFYYVPTEKATLTIRPGRDTRSRSPIQIARLLFINEKQTQITAIINDSVKQTFNPPSSPDLQTIELTGEIQSVHFSFGNVEGFVGYGVCMNDEKGVYVDNYSVRGFSGLTLASTNGELSRRFDHFVPTNVVVLQYGINSTRVNITNYSNYKLRMVNVINTLKSHLPNSIFIIMGVSDRATRGNNSVETMPGIIPMVETQREIAKETECIFWDTFAAMGGKNSIVSFVSHNPPLASKDYTHINHAGGRRIAQTFVSSLLREMETIEQMLQENDVIQPIPPPQPANRCFKVIDTLVIIPPSPFSQIR